jgi:serine/threonine protein kinase
MTAGDEPAGAREDPARDVHESETVAHARHADFETMTRQENSSPESAPVADLAEFSRLLVEIGLISDQELKTFAALSPEGVLGLSRALVKAGKLTAYQAAAIYQKKSRGLLVGNYLILDKLGQGGMGVVFKARHRRLGRIGALKILPPSFARDRDAVMRFRREVEAAGRLTHPNLVAAQDADEDRGVHFLVMDYVEGRDLDRVVRERGLMQVTEAIDCLIQAARGLEAAHGQGIIHRDIKPGNLMLAHDGTVRVLDLGLARIVDAANPFSKSAAGRLTQSGMYMGTVDFMAPEQAEDSHRVDHRADIYSLGCTFYYLLTGRVPFSGDNVLKRLMAHMERPAPSLRIARPDVPPALDAAYLKMMAKSPQDRPASMAEVISLLDACKTAAEAKTAAFALPETKRELKVFDEAPLKRAAPPRTKIEPSIFARPKEAEGLVRNDELRLEDLVMDVRSGSPPTPLPAGSKPAPGSVQPFKRMSSTGSRGRSSRRGLVYLAVAAPVVLGAVFVGLAMFRESARENGPAPAPADTLAATDPPDHVETTAPEVTPEPAPDNHAILPQPSAPPSPPSNPPEDVKRLDASKTPQQATVQTLLNGEDLSRWIRDGGSGTDMHLENGDLVVSGTGDYRKLGWFLSDRSFSDFILRFEFQLSRGANSGVALRAKGGDRVAGLPVHPEVSLLDAGKRAEETGTFAWSNSLRSQDWLPLDRRSHLNPVGQWNAMEIELRGKALRVNINGSDVLTKDLTTLAARPQALPGIKRDSGSIGFQAHTGTVRFRNIRVEELIRSPAESVDGGDTVAGGGRQEIASPSFFDGKTLAGWEGLKGYWSVHDGAIVGRCPQGKPAHTFLCSTRSYSDFELRFTAKLTGGVGNSGVQFRSRITDHRNFRAGGPQCEIAALSVNYRYPPGSLVTEPSGQAIAAPRERVAERYKIGDFNEFVIRCVGKHVTIRVNGIITVDADWPAMPSEGIIAWQIHGADTPREVVFKDVTLVEVRPGRGE